MTGLAGTETVATTRTDSCGDKAAGGEAPLLTFHTGILLEDAFVLDVPKLLAQGGGRWRALGWAPVASLAAVSLTAVSWIVMRGRRLFGDMFLLACFLLANGRQQE
jgi:hypothetical protein